MNDYYRLGHRQPGRPKHRKKMLGIVFVSSVVVIAISTYIYLSFRPKTDLKQATAITTKVNYSGNSTRHYDEPDFTIDLPSSWQLIPRPAGPYKSFTWQRSDHGTNGEEITVYQDTIPQNFAVNRVLIVEPDVSKLTLKGSASDNCSTYTKNMAQTNNQFGAPAKWQGVDFLCDQSNQERDVIGTSSTDGVNTVILQSPHNGLKHKFLFSYTNHSINPDYTVFYTALGSFELK